jgi:N-acetylmuramoyl-L-alanine amidase
MRVFRFLVLILLLTTGATASMAAPVVRDMRIGVHPEKTRFVLDLSEEIPYRAFTLPDPFRVVIDFPEVEWAAGEPPIGPTSGVVQAMRFGRFEPGTMRIVLDVARPVIIEKAYLLAPRDGKAHRFVLDLRTVSAAEYASLRAAQPLSSSAPLVPPQPAIARLKPRRKPTNTLPMIVIDSGHGGVDPGAISVTGYKEKSLTLDYGRALRDALLATGRYRVTMTRSDDRFIKLRDRMGIAQRVGGDLFISLHANSHNSRKIRGASVYTVSEKASDAEAARVAEKENAADAIAGVNLSQHPDDVRDILLDLTWRETKNLSKQFADTIIKEVGTVNSLLPNSHRFAGFAVLKSPTVPSVLLEIGYMSHPKEAQMLQRRSHRNKIVGAMVRAIDRYFEWQQMVSRS